MNKREKFECVEQLFDNEYCFDHKALLLSLEALDLAVKTLKRCDQTPAVVKTIDYLEARITKATGGAE